MSFDFDKFHKDTRQEQRRLIGLSLLMLPVMLVVYAAFIAGIAWVVCLVLQHFGVIAK